MTMGQHDIVEIMNCERSMQPYCWETWMDAELRFVPLREINVEIDGLSCHGL